MLNNYRKILLVMKASAVSLPVSRGHTPWSAPDKLEASLPSGLTLGMEIFYMRWKDIFNSARTHVHLGRKKSLCLIWQFKASHFRNFCSEEGRSILWFMVTAQNKADLQESVCRSPHRAREDNSSITGELNNWKRSFIKAEWSNDSNLFIPLSTFLSSIYSSLCALISSTKKTDS